MFLKLAQSFCVSVAMLACAIAAAQVPQLTAIHCDHPPKMDANAKDAIWQSIVPADNFKDSTTGKPVVDQTECRVLYDDDSLYVLFVCHDSQPTRIVGREIVPEAQFNGEDVVIFSIDPYNSRSGSSMSHFTVNAINTRAETIAGGRSSKAEWRGIWDSATRRTSDGFVVEMRIPWRIFNYPKSLKPVDMDINFDRYQAWSKTSSQWAYVTPNFKPELLGLLKEIAPPAHDARSRLQFLAYDAPGIDDGKFSNRAGLDARYAITNDQTALLSITPDFINIEQQIAGVDFVHTERFLNDARPFFTEGGDFFNPMAMYEYGMPFYSERIGPINVGSKFYGQISPLAKLGTMVLNESDGAVDSFTNYALNIGSTLSGSAYATTYDLGSLHDQLVGDTVTKRWGNWFVHNATAVEDNGQSRETAGNNAFGFSGPKLFSEIQQIWVDPSFNPPLAYVPWQDRRGAYTYSNYSDTIPKGMFHDWNMFLYTPDFHQSDGTIQERGMSTGVTLTTRDDQQFQVNKNLVDYATGTDNNFDLLYTYNASNRFKQFGVEYLSGTQNSMPSRYLSLHGSYRAFHRIDLGLSQSVLVFNPDATQTIATVGWQIDSRRAITARFVETNGQQNFFASYQSAGWSGTEVYFILGDPNATTFSRRISLKLVWAF